LGNFFYKNITSYFIVEGKEYRINGEKELFKKSTFTLTDIRDNTSIGVYAKSFWRHLLKNEIGRIIISEQYYVCTRTWFVIIKNSILSTKMRVAIKFFLKSKSDIISYSMIYNTSSVGDGSSDYKPSSGFSCQVSSSTNNSLALFADIFLIEKYFDY